MIREFKISDLAALKMIAASSFGASSMQKGIEISLKEEFNHCLVMEEEKEVIGYVLYNSLYENADILALAIRKDRRGKGYGQKLLNYLLVNLKEKGIEQVFLEVRASNRPALKLYQKCGFNKLRTIRSYYPDNYEDAYALALRLGGFNAENISD